MEREGEEKNVPHQSRHKTEMCEVESEMGTKS